MNKQINLYRKFEKIEGEIVKTIKLDIRIRDIVLNDQFEWDINNPTNKPETFAQILCTDLGLGPEFILPISHSIKEQILEHQRSFMNEKKIYYKMLYNQNKNTNFKNPAEGNTLIRDIFSETTEWQPIVKQISSSDIKKFEKKEERKHRYFQRKK